MKFDIVMPYDGKNDQSLRLVLRSIDQYFPVNQIYIITTADMSSYQNLTIIKHPDRYNSNKDANLFEKVFKACENDLTDPFLFWSDDQILLKPYELQIVKNERNPLSLDPDSKWLRRLIRTAKYIQALTSVAINYNYDSHVPQPMTKDNFLKIKNIDYVSGDGYCICTLYYGINGLPDGVWQKDVKATFQDRYINLDSIKDKMFVGYNETGFDSVKQELVKLFPNKSRFEK